MSSAAVIIPYGGECPHRHRNLQYVLGYYRDTLPDVPVVIAANEGIFHKARAVNQAVAGLPAYISVLVLNDADSLCYPSALTRALELAAEAPGLVAAFTPYRWLGPALSTTVTDWRGALYSHAWVREQPTSESHGCVAMRRNTFTQAGGYDERFVGWGYEDLAFNVAAETLRPTRRVAGPLVHLWHPPAVENPQNAELHARYERARGDKQAIAELVAEAVAC